jgi:hypothetical protein
VKARAFAAAIFILVMLPHSARGEASFPAPDQPWTSRDYVDFYFAHHALHLALPHLRGPEQARLFSRLTARENIERLTGSSAPLERKLTDLNMVLAAMGSVRAAYAYALLVGEPVAQELTEVRRFLIFLLDRAGALAAQAEAEASPAWKTSYVDVVASLSERETLSRAQRLSVLRSLLEARQLPALFSAAARAEIAGTVARIAGDERDPELAKGLADLALLLAPR